MAARRQAIGHRQTYTKSGIRQEYVYGNTVRKPEVLPKRKIDAQPRHTRKTSRLVRKNRNRAMSMNPAYAVFLTAAVVCAVLICVAYLKLQSDIVSGSQNVSALQKELADLTEKNDTAYNAAADSVNLEDIRSKAMNDMGMVYASQGHVVEYQSPTSDYVMQYSDIPSDGVLAKSKSAED